MNYYNFIRYFLNFPSVNWKNSNNFDELSISVDWNNYNNIDELSNNITEKLSELNNIVVLSLNYDIMDDEDILLDKPRLVRQNALCADDIKKLHLNFQIMELGRKMKIAVREIKRYEEIMEIDLPKCLNNIINKYVSNYEINYNKIVEISRY